MIDQRVSRLRLGELAALRILDEQESRGLYAVATKVPVAVSNNRRESPFVSPRLGSTPLGY